MANCNFDSVEAYVVTETPGLQAQSDSQCTKQPLTPLWACLTVLTEHAFLSITKLKLQAATLLLSWYTRER